MISVNHFLAGFRYESVIAYVYWLNKNELTTGLAKS